MLQLFVLMLERLSLYFLGGGGGLALKVYQIARSIFFSAGYQNSDRFIILVSVSKPTAVGENIVAKNVCSAKVS